MTDLIVGAAAVTAGLGGMIWLGWVHRKRKEGAVLAATSASEPKVSPRVAATRSGAADKPEWNERDAQLMRMSRIELQGELTRCAGAIMACADGGDKRGMRHAHRAMRPIMRALKKRKTVHVAA